MLPGQAQIEVVLMIHLVAAAAAAVAGVEVEHVADVAAASPIQDP